MLPLALGFLPCQVTVDLGVFPDRLAASAICRVEVRADAPALWLDAGLALDEVLAENGGMAVYPVPGEVEDGLVPWSLPGLPVGSWRLRLRYVGDGWTATGDATRLDTGSAPRGEGTGCVAISFLRAPEGVSLLMARGGVLCAPDQEVVAGRWTEWDLVGDPAVSVARSSATPPHPDWLPAIQEGMAAGAAALSLPAPSVRVAGAHRWSAEPGLAWVPDSALDAPPDAGALAPLLAAQWLPPGQDPRAHPLGRFIMPYVGGNTSPLSRRLADRAALARSSGGGRVSGLGVDQVLAATARADAAAVDGWVDCGEIPWPSAQIAEVVVTRLRRGYETRVAVDFDGNCPTRLEVEVAGGSRTSRAAIVLDRGRSTILVQGTFRPETLVMDPDARFPGALERDMRIPLLGTAGRAYTLWLQPIGLAGAVGPGGVSWPEAGTVRLPDGAELPWNGSSVLALADGSRGWTIRPAEGPDTPTLPDGPWLGHGWVLLQDGVPVRWGTRPGGPPLELPPPSDLLDLN